MTADKGESVRRLIADCAFQLLAQHPQGRSYHDSSEISVLKQSVVVFIHILQVPLIIIVIFRRKRTTQVSIRLECLVEVRHNWNYSLCSCKVEQYLHFGNLKGVFGLKYRNLGCNFKLSTSHQGIVIGTVIQNIIQRTHGKRLKSFIESKRLLIILFLKRLKGERSKRWVQFIRRYSFGNNPSFFQGIEAIYE
jgi:hypothetical protein